MTEKILFIFERICGCWWIEDIFSGDDGLNSKDCKYCVTFWKSEISPPAPKIVLLPIASTRLISWNLASDPYEPNVSAAIITNDLVLIAITVVPVTIGRLFMLVLFNIIHLFWWFGGCMMDVVDGMEICLSYVVWVIGWCLYMIEFYVFTVYERQRKCLWSN